MPTLHDFDAVSISGEPVSLRTCEGKIVLVVNTASACGLTPQYEGLQTLQDTFGPRGFTVLAFPCNQFGGQEPGTHEEIAQFCNLRFQTTFPLFEKVDVNGSNAHPLWKWLKETAPGALGIEAIKWNFSKFLVGRDGNVVRRYAPTTTPAELAADIEAALAAR